MEGSKRTTARIGHLCPSTKKSKKKKKAKQKRYNLIIESFLSNNKSNFFKSIKTPTSGKNPWSPSQKWSNDSYLQENQGL